MKNHTTILRSLAVLLSTFAVASILNAGVIDFEDVAITTDPSASSGQGEALRYAAGSGENIWSSGIAQFTLNEESYGSWSGATVSKSTNTVFSDWTNMYSSVTGGGYNASSQYGIVYYSEYAGAAVDIINPELVNFSSMYITNTTYTNNSLGVGDGFANNLQYYADLSQYAELKITIKGINSMGEYTDKSVEVVLGNTFENSETGLWEVYILKDWQSVDLTTLNELDGLYGLSFTMDGTDKGSGYNNWPLYFAMDNISYSSVPEPATYAMIFGALSILVAIVKRRLNK